MNFGLQNKLSIYLFVNLTSRTFDVMRMEKRTCVCPACGGTGQIEAVVRISTADTHRAIAQKLRKEGVTIRDIAKMLGYKNPGSITHLLSKPKKKKK